MKSIYTEFIHPKHDSLDQLFKIECYLVSESNITAFLPTPHPPHLLFSSYFSFTLRWNEYSQTKYNASPIMYVLEVTRHQNTSDPAVILPHLKKYHVVG